MGNPSPVHPSFSCFSRGGKHQPVSQQTDLDDIVRYWFEKADESLDAARDEMKPVKEATTSSL
jgi:hypothetical protein